MTDPLGQLGRVSRAYQEYADRFGDLLAAAALAEAAHKTARAKRILQAMDAGPRVSVAKAEVSAEADDTIAQLYQERLITAAKVDAHRAKLMQLREQVANGRTYVASAREVDRMHAEGTGGAA